jgi:GTP:adenosylcobinamide-phosphate guanylyltransferase
VKALIMAGGRATRFGAEVEKALLEVGGRSLLERAVRTLRSDLLSGIHVVVSHHTPRTTERAREMGVEVIETRGLGYHQDLLELLDKIDDAFLTLNVDVPFIREHHVVRILEAFDGRSIAAATPTTSALTEPREESVGNNATGMSIAWVGLNIVTREPETEVILLDDPLLAVNVNDEDDLKLANKISYERGL